MIRREVIIAIIDAVADKHGISRRDLLEYSKFAHVCTARDEAIRRVKEEFNYSNIKLADIFDRDPSSIWASLNREKKRAKSRAQYWRDLERGRQERSAA